MKYIVLKSMESRNITVTFPVSVCDSVRLVSVVKSFDSVEDAIKHVNDLYPLIGYSKVWHYDESQSLVVCQGTITCEIQGKGTRLYTDIFTIYRVA